MPLNRSLRVAYSVASVAADIDLDGRVEIIAGRTVYDFEGRTRWHRDDIKPVPYQDFGGNWMNTSGYVAIGNFDLDDQAEIVLSANDELWLLNHDGTTIWGPKYAPDFGDLGAPSVVDIDDDGLPEIIVSSNRKLTVLETDGTDRRTFDINDVSGVTSATVFDFENDGLPKSCTWTRTTCASSTRARWCSVSSRQIRRAPCTKFRSSPTRRRQAGRDHHHRLR